MQDWIHWNLADQIAGLENAGLEKQDWKMRDQKCRTKRFRFLAVNLCVLYRVLIIVCFNVCFPLFCVQFLPRDARSASAVLLS